jgi:hypothetical protein
VRPSPRQLRAIVALAPALVLACGGGEGNPLRPPFTGIRAVAGAGAADTILAALKQALIVEVRDGDGRPVHGVVVRFEAQPPADTLRRFEPALFVCSLSAANCVGYGTQFYSDTTDSEGRAKAIIRLGQVAGRAVVKLGVPELGLEDSASFTVTAGAPARIFPAVRDTAVEVGGKAVLRGRVTDRYGNPRPEQPQLSAGTGSVVSVDAPTSTVTGQEMGMQWVYTRYDTLVDSTSVRVIPTGRLVVWAAFARQIRLVNLDGSSATSLVSSVSSDLGTFPHFDGTRQKVTLHAGSASNGGPPNTIIVVDTATHAARYLAAADGFGYVIAERQMADGSLLVVGEHGTDTEPGLWKVLADDSATLLASLPALQMLYDGADISRDGSTLAYMATNAGVSELRTLDVATGATTTITTAGRSPRWSPDGTRLAYLSPVGYLDGKLRIRNADGSETTWARDYLYSPGLAWSPDGRYIVGRSSESGYPGLRLVRVHDGAFVMLRFRNSSGSYEEYYQPDWR